MGLAAVFQADNPLDYNSENYIRVCNEDGSQSPRAHYLQVNVAQWASTHGIKELLDRPVLRSQHTHL